jgi:hypothetical protein
MLYLDFGKGKTYSSKNTAAAAIPNPATEDITIRGYLNDDGMGGTTRIYANDQSLVLATNSMTPSRYRLRFIGMEGSIKTGNQIKFVVAASQNNWVQTNSWAHAGLSFENMEVETVGTTRGIQSTGGAAWVTLREIKIKSENETCLSSNVIYRIINCVMESTGTVIAAVPLAITVVYAWSSIFVSNGSFSHSGTGVVAAYNCAFVNQGTRQLFKYGEYKQLVNCLCYAAGNADLFEIADPATYADKVFSCQNCLIHTGSGNAIGGVSLADYIAARPGQFFDTVLGDPLLTATGDALEYCVPLPASPLLASNRAVRANQLYATNLQPVDIGAYSLYTAPDLPDAVNVLTVDTTGGVQGRWHPADPAKYQDGEQYGVDGTSETGTLEVKDLTFAEEAARNTDPGENNVRWQTTYKIINANKEGNVFLPDESEVQSGVAYDSNAERTGTLISISNPGENNVREGVAYGGGGIVFYGNLIVPTSGEVQAGVNYDTNGSITGTYDPLGTAPSAPVFGTVTVSGTTATVPLTAGNPADKIYLRYRSFPSGAWSAQSETLSRTGSGNITLAGLSVGRYELAAYALNIQYSAPSVPTLITVQPTAQPIFDQLVDAVAAMIDDLNLVTADNTAYTVSTAWPPEWSNKSTPTIFVTQGSIRARPMMGGAQERDLTVEIILCERGDDDSLVANRDRNIEAIQTAIITTPRPVNLVWIDAEPLGETHAYDPDDVLQYNIMSAFSATYHTRSN